MVGSIVSRDVWWSEIVTERPDVAPSCLVLLPQRWLLHTFAGSQPGRQKKAASGNLLSPGSDASRR